MVPAAAPLRAGTNVVLGYNVPTLSSTEAAAAGRLAAALDGSLVVAHVEGAGAPSRAPHGRLDDAVRRVTHQAAVAAGRRLDVHRVNRRGRAFEQLDAVASSHHAGVVVVGNHRNGWRDILSRSVAMHLHRPGSHPVLVVPRRAQMFAG